MKRNLVRAILTSAFGHALIVALVFAISMAIRLTTGYYPSLTFTLSLLTFRLIELNQVFLIGPLLSTAFTVILLSRTSINTRFL